MDFLWVRIKWVCTRPWTELSGPLHCISWDGETVSSATLVAGEGAIKILTVRNSIFLEKLIMSRRIKILHFVEFEVSFLCSWLSATYFCPEIHIEGYGITFNFNIFTCMLRSFKRPLLFRFPHRNLVIISVPLCTLYVLRGTPLLSKMKLQL